MGQVKGQVKSSQVKSTWGEPVPVSDQLRALTLGVGAPIHNEKGGAALGLRFVASLLALHARRLDTRALRSDSRGSRL